ncbi:MAG: cardiolipin synthase [Phycisphaerales bacterium]
MPTWWPILVLLTDYALRLGLIGRVLSRKLPVSTTLAWSFVLLFLPFLGAFVYLLIGENRLGSKRLARHRSIAADLEERALGRWKGGATDWTHESAPFDQVAKLCAAVTGLPPLKGNRLTLLSDSEETLNSLIRDIDAAEHHLHMCYYIWTVQGNGPTRVAEAVVRAKKRGVECRVLVDAVGSGDFLACDDCSRMRAAGVEVVSALPVNALRALVARIDLRNHRKLTVIDGRIAYIGSQNLNDSSFNVRGSAGPGPWVDATVRVEGPAAQALTVMFARDWELDCGRSIDPLEDYLPDFGEVAEGGVVQLAPSGPGSGPLAIQQAILTTIYAAREELVITTPYFVPDDATRSALEAAAKRGVDVTLVVPKKVNSPLLALASKSEFGNLLRAGVKIRQHRPGLLHAKTITVDRRFAMIGSVNIDMRSFWLNFEATLFVYDNDFSSQVRWLQTSYIDSADELKIGEWSKRPVVEKIAEHVARLFGPLL